MLIALIGSVGYFVLQMVAHILAKTDVIPPLLGASLSAMSFWCWAVSCCGGRARELRIDARDTGSAARTTSLTLPHGTVSTPAFMPVGTNASVKAVWPRDLLDLGFRMVLANSYHLYLRPGADTVARPRRLHRFMAWQGNLLTDSGGFQVFSLAPLRNVDDDGVAFRSHLDGSRTG